MNAETLETMMSSANSDWNTPQKLLDVVYAFDKIRLDPCSNSNSVVAAANHLCGFGIDDDGLTANWGGYGGLVYVNPPYGKDITDWVEKCMIESFNGVEIIALLPSRTDTKWWHNNIPSAQAVCFWKGRLKFVGAQNCAPFPSAIAYWGKRPYRFAEKFQNHGMISLQPVLLNKINNVPKL